MDGVLYARMLKAQSRSISSYAFGMVLYLWLFIWVFPTFAGSQSLNNLLRQMPPGLMKVLGYTVGITHLSNFLSGEFYSLLYLVIMAIYVIFGATRLVAHLIDTRAMAYLLATPVSRVKVAVAEAFVLLTGVLIIGGLTTAGGLLGAHWFVHHAGIDAGRFVEMNIVGALLFCVVAGYCYIFSCVAPDERRALSFSAVLTVAFYGFHVIGDMSHKFSWMNHLSLFASFNSQNLVQGHSHFAASSIGLGIAAVVLFAAGIIAFSKRQLAL